MIHRFRFALSALLAGAVLSLSTTPAQTPAPGTSMVQTSDFGSLPKEIVWADDGATMVLIPAGEYRIGPAGEEVTVKLGSFYIDKHEVTQELYQAIAPKVGAGIPRQGNNPGLNAPELPVVSISYDDAALYAKGTRKDLPTEAEWEAAARGPQAALYPWGNAPGAEGDVVTGRGTYGLPDAPGKAARDLGPMGVADMAGNVAEWVKDFYARDYVASMAGKTNPTGPESGDAKVVRGGNFTAAGDGRLTERQPGLPGMAREEIGFRTVFRVVPPPTATPVPTPRPTPAPTVDANALTRALHEALDPLFRDPSIPVPDGIRKASPASSPSTIYNQTANTVRIGFGHGGSGILAGFPQDLAPGEIVSTLVPKDEPYTLFAYSPDAPEKGLLNLGPVNGTSNPTLVIKAGTFGTTINLDGEPYTDGQDTLVVGQYYGTYSAPWHLFQVANRTDLPLVVEVGQQQDKETFKVLVEQRLAAGETLVVDRYGKSELTLRVNYVNAPAEAAKTAPLILDESVAQRVILVEQNAQSENTVRVLTRRVPELNLRVFESQPPLDVKGSERQTTPRRTPRR